MANIAENSNLDVKRFVVTTSRYADSTVIYYGDMRRLTLSTYKRSVPEVSPQDQFMVITKGVEYRPDLVSMRAYGLPDLWWRIMEANNIYDIYDFKAGLNIRIPSLL